MKLFNKKKKTDKYGFQEEDSEPIFWWIVAGLFMLGLIFYMTLNASAQTITKFYAPNLKVRIDNSNPNELKPCDIYYPGGGFVFQIWNVCNVLSTMSVAANHVSCKVGYSTALAYPTASAANRGITDCMNAVAWVKKNWKAYGIDTNKIYLWGTSAGGFCALGAYQHKVRVAGIVNMWGGVLQKNYLTLNNIPVLNVSTQFDPTVPLGCGKAFGVSCCGSQAITDELMRLGVKTDWLQFESQKHGVKDLQSVTKIFNEAQLFFK